MTEANAARRPSGELEASVLAALWAADGRALTPADVQRDLGTELARTTVTTILARLHEKGSVSRTRSGRGYAYLPVQDSPGLAARRMRTELDKSASDDRGTVLARFVSELGPDDERVLRALLGEAAVGSPGGSEGSGGGPHPAAPSSDPGGSAPPGPRTAGASGGFPRSGEAAGPDGPVARPDGPGAGPGGGGRG